MLEKTRPAAVIVIVALEAYFHALIHVTNDRFSVMWQRWQQSGGFVSLWRIIGCVYREDLLLSQRERRFASS